MQASPARFNRWILVVAGLGFLALLALLAYGKQFLRMPSFSAVTSTKPPPSTVQLPESLRKQPTPLPSAQPAPVDPVRESPSQAGSSPATMPHPAVGDPPPPRPAAPELLPAPVSPAGTVERRDSRRTGTRQGATAATAATATPPQKPPPKKGWLFPERKTEQKAQGPPFPLPMDEEDGAPGESTTRRTSQLFPKAVWETPEDPTKVLYSSQLIHGVLSQDINTDIPGSVRILVTQPVEDRWGHGQVLVPLYTIFLGKTEGEVKYGQRRIPLKIHKAELPDGTDILFEGQAGDAGGAHGLPGRVNNHYGKLALGVVATALLNIGTRVPFGSTQGFQPSLSQEMAQQAGQGINQAGQKVIQRELAVDPTITKDRGDPVTISFEKNISFQTPPRKVKQ